MERKRVNKIIKGLKTLSTESAKNIHVSLLQLEKELSAINSYQRNQKISLKSLDKFKAIDKLQIGGGSRILAGYINIDIFKPADLVWDVRSGIPFQNERFNEIFCEHFFEHLDYPQSALFVLSEMYRTLKRGGVLKIIVPDCGKPLLAYSKKDKSYFKRITATCFGRRMESIKINSSIDVVNYMFRDQFDNPKYTVHWWAYDQESLSKKIKEVGFTSVQKWHFDHKICNPKRKDYSLYLLAKK